MATIVQKYGGTSVEGREKLLAIAEGVAALRRDGHDVVVVVSAPGTTTDSLLSEAAAIAAEPAQRELDMLMTAGERISMSLLSIALNSIGCPAVSFTGSQVGIITDTRHTDARILEVRPHRVVDELAAGNVVVVGGFQGVSTEKDVTTLGRGGSDTTAVALAAALGADRCEIMTDVDGVYTADPRIVPNARKLDRISHDEMLELASMGAGHLRAQLDDLGLVASSNHGPLPTEDNVDEIVEAAKTLGYTRCISGMGPDQFSTKEGTLEAAEKFQKAAELLKPHGLTFGVHNHWWEFARIFNGHSAYEIIMNAVPDLLSELDIYWVTKGGADAVQIVKTWSKRIPLLHVKDGELGEESIMTAVGEGKVPVKSILEAARSDTLQWLIVELDNCETDMFQAVEKSCTWLIQNQFAKGKG